MKNRHELLFNIPVFSSSVEAFCQRSVEDDFHSMKVAEQISFFINQKHILPYQVQLYYFKELVKNAYDAYAISGLEVGQHLNLEIVLEDKEDGIFIKIKDNGSGFSGHEKGETFNRLTVNITEKGFEQGFIGGEHVGLLRFEENLHRDGGKLSFKNRKKQGATVTLFFKHAKVTNDISSASSETQHSYHCLQGLKCTLI